ncbi:MAG: DNA gyrase inhibitor YacG [Bacteriovoracaceae bacterium]|nr:DNA gyrase inhibitor YacG [Bacteriovoracaceae bacterium]
MNKVLNVRCPHCGTKFSYYESKFRPFCTERCRMVDLGHWLEESYRVPDKSLGTDKAEEVVNNSDFDADNLDEESDELFDYQEDDNYE